MNTNSSGSMGDKELLTDSIASQKLISNNYNVFASECVNVNLKNDFLSILREEQQIQTDLYNEMQKNGWYQVSQADQNKIAQARMKYSNMK